MVFRWNIFFFKILNEIGTLALFINSFQRFSSRHSLTLGTMVLALIQVIYKVTHHFNGKIESCSWSPVCQKKEISSSLPLLPTRISQIPTYCHEQFLLPVTLFTFDALVNFKLLRCELIKSNAITMESNNSY